ncbi:hypothetical protein GCM10023187_14540 [Nibrella viscosa]|uniref:DUF4440 domain-containing protein n=2 Tax=Nibrella viscosa TaxID=1084524 RepID=A0ABP8K615_9BACT
MVFFLGSSLTASAQSAGAQNHAADEQAIRVLERQMFDAAMTGDADAFERLLAPEYYTINHDGSFMDGRVGQVALMRRMGKKAPPLKGLNLSVDYKLGDTKFRFLDDNTALLTGWSAYYAGPIMLARVRHTEGWVRQNGQWKFVHWQGTSDGLVGEWATIAATVLVTLLVSWLVRLGWRRWRKPARRGKVVVEA